MKYSNPVTSAHFNDWPYGRTARCIADFKIEGKMIKDHLMERMIRTTTLGTTINKPKYTTYYEKCILVTGEDGKLYVLCKLGSMIEIKKSDLKHTHAIVWDDDDQFIELLELFDAVKTNNADA